MLSLWPTKNRKTWRMPILIGESSIGAQNHIADLVLALLINGIAYLSSIHFAGSTSDGTGCLI